MIKPSFLCELMLRDRYADANDTIVYRNFAIKIVWVLCAYLVLMLLSSNITIYGFLEYYIKNVFTYD